MQTEAPKTPGVSQQKLPSTREDRPLFVYVSVCLLGAALTGPAAAIGLILVAYGAAVLGARGHVLPAYLAVVVGGLLCWFWGVDYLLMALGAGAVGVFMATHAFRGEHDQLRFFIGSIVLTAVALGTDMLFAYLAGTTLEGQIAAMVNLTIQQMTGAGTIPAEAVTVLQEMLPAYLNIWPSFYVVQGLFYGVVIYIAAYYALVRHDGDLKLRPLVEADLPVHVLWVLLAALLCLAASYVPVIGHSNFFSVIGYNLMVCSVAVFAIQGFAVIGYGMRKAGWHWAVRLIAYLVLIQLELMFLAPSLVGLVDVWANFRKLPRDSGSGGSESEPTA